MYSSATIFVKLSLFLLYLRLFKPDKVTRWLIYGGILANGLFYSIITIIYCAIFPPPLDHPNTDIRWTTHAKKHDFFFKRMAIVNGAFGNLSDIYLLIIPIRSIFQLQLPIRRKFEVSSIFLIGILWVIIFDSWQHFDSALNLFHSALSRALSPLQCTASNTFTLKISRGLFLYFTLCGESRAS